MHYLAEGVFVCDIKLTEWINITAAASRNYEEDYPLIFFIRTPWYPMQRLELFYYRNSKVVRFNVSHNLIGTIDLHVVYNIHGEKKGTPFGASFLAEIPWMEFKRLRASASLRMLRAF